ncbi:Isochorismatase-like protein [Tuber indicum]|nr:Isochorismatase-like protein [Tuber indicum]
MGSRTEEDFVPTLLVVDFQEDFCPPNGSLAVQGGRDIAPIVNALLALPFALKVATKDWHPRDHVSFASNHPPPDNVPFVSNTTVFHPDGSDTGRHYTTLLWPDHCVQNTPGAELVPEIDISRIDAVIEKGQDARVEMYSAFTDPFHLPPFTPESTSVSTSGLPKMLHEKGITDVFVVGLAQDFCVRASAIDAARFGYRTFVVREGTRAVVPGTGWEKAEEEMAVAGVKIVGIEGKEVERVKGRGKEGIE